MRYTACFPPFPPLNELAATRSKSGRLLSRPGVSPYLPAHALDALADDDQSDAGAGIFARIVQALEHAEDALRISGIKTDPIILNLEPHRLRVGRLGPDPV